MDLFHLELSTGGAPGGRKLEGEVGHFSVAALPQGPLYVRPFERGDRGVSEEERVVRSHVGRCGQQPEVGCPRRTVRLGVEGKSAATEKDTEVWGGQGRKTFGSRSSLIDMKICQESLASWGYVCFP